MGFNTSITICNDNLDDYLRDPQKFANFIWNSVVDGDQIWGITVHPSEHADYTQLIAVGGNCSTKVHSTIFGAFTHHTEAGQIAILRSWADELGYQIRRKKR